jgi:multicomponent Na+:H+ antiporter subunit F
MTQLATVVAPILIAVLTVPLALAAYRMIRGPGYADRFVALDMLTAVSVALSALTALVTGRSAFLDIGMGLALVNFVSTCAFATLLERKRGGRK